MKITIRPEQVSYVVGLKAKADTASAVYLAALNAAVAGLVPAGSRVDKLHDDGTVDVTVPDEGGKDG
jgi:hypothetical protein